MEVHLWPLIKATVFSISSMSMTLSAIYDDREVSSAHLHV